MQTLKKNKGFTIIEVVLVLAIAGLIFLMVFIALPALQRSQADTQRRSDAGRLLSAVTNYETNNRGNAPTYTQVVNSITSAGDQFTDPSGNPYTQNTSGSGTLATGEIYYQSGAVCNPAGSGPTTTFNGQPVGARKVAVIVGLSNSTSAWSGTYCTSN
jgi:prepilin-type N-terminal cleavage/methylation domain-containing protein